MKKLAAGLIERLRTVTTCIRGKMEGKRRRRRREAGLITFPADFTGGREVKITASAAHCSRPPLLPPLLLAF